jgi:hypothetical protein
MADWDFLLRSLLYLRFILLLPIKDYFTFLLNLVVLCVLLVLTDHGDVGDGQKGEFLTKGGRSLRCEW